MRRFFWDGAADNGIATLKGSEARHIREVLRMNAGQEVVLCDGIGNDFCAVAEQIGLDFVKFRLTEKLSENNEPKLSVTLYLAHTKGERLDFAVQKAVEVGASSIKLFQSERCITTGSTNKLLRLNRIAMEAAKQSGRSRLIGVEDIGEFQQALEYAEGTKLFCYELEKETLRSKIVGLKSDVSVMCGPEGGFAPEEAEAARRTGWHPVSLGRRILRTETAPLVILSVLFYESLDI